MAEVNLEFLARQNEQILSELRKVRAEVADIRTLTLQGVEYSRRLERRMGELGSDLEVMLKAELIGRLTHLETRMDEHLDDLGERLTALEGGPRP